MDEKIRFRGKIFSKREIEDVREVIARYPDKSRFFLSKELCRLWNWAQANGTPRDMVCRSLLLKLHAEGHITLPPPRMVPTWLKGPRKPPARIEVDDSPCGIPLAGLMPLSLRMVRRTPSERLYKGLIEEHHYLGYTRPVGEHLEYIAFSDDRPVACIGFCSAPRHIGTRDRYLGWNRQERLTNLHKITVNTRFLILPWVRVPHLASHLLGQIARSISPDWEHVYSHRIIWLETFVDPARGFTGTCYKAANWRYLGLTTGRGKNDNARKPNRSLKYVFGYPLVKDFRKALYGVL
jgi:hypothetical protein